MIGADERPGVTRRASCQVEAFGRDLLYSDGVFEIERTDGTMWPFSEFLAFMGRAARVRMSPSPSPPWTA